MTVNHWTVESQSERARSGEKPAKPRPFIEARREPDMGVLESAMSKILESLQSLQERMRVCPSNGNSPAYSQKELSVN